LSESLDVAEARRIYLSEEWTYPFCLPWDGVIIHIGFSTTFLPQNYPNNRENQEPAHSLKNLKFDFLLSRSPKGTFWACVRLHGSPYPHREKVGVPPLSVLALLRREV